MVFTKKLFILGLIIFVIIFISMGLFSFLKKSTTIHNTISEPYKDSARNLIYNLLFCDNLELYKANSQSANEYPFDILFSETSSASDLQKVIDGSSEPRVKILAYNKQLSIGYKPTKKELLAVILEIGLDSGLDVLASFNNGTARYINQTGKMLIWETTTDETSNELTKTLFADAQIVVNQIGPWHKPRKPYPTKGNMRITFLVSDGLYFGEGPIDVLFNDPIASPALTSATQLLQYLTKKSLEANK